MRPAHPRTALPALAALLAAALAAPPLPAADWPQFRGPQRDGRSAETGLARSWGEAGPPVVWRVPVGTGYSSLAVAGGGAYTLLARDGSEFVVRLDAATGREVWRARLGRDFREDPETGNGPRSTPTVDGDRLYALGSYGNFAALEAATGKVLWQHDLGQEFGAELPHKWPHWGYSTSALVEGDQVVLEIGGGRDQAFAAFDRASGKVRWTAHSDEPAYTSPIAVDAAGRRQLVFLTASHVVGLTPQGRVLWTYPFPTQYGINVATPVSLPEDRIFVSAAYDKGAAMIRLRSDGEGVRAERLWESRVMENHFNSSVLHGGHLYGFHRGTLKCIEAATGKEMWANRDFGLGSLILADGRLWVLGEQGQLAVAEARPDALTVQAKAQVLNGKCWTPPALAGGRLYLRNQSEAVCLDVSGKPEAPARRSGR